MVFLLCFRSFSVYCVKFPKSTSLLKKKEKWPKNENFFIEFHLGMQSKCTIRTFFKLKIDKWKQTISSYLRIQVQYIHVASLDYLRHPCFYKGKNILQNWKSLKCYYEQNGDRKKRGVLKLTRIASNTFFNSCECIC